MKKHNLTGQTLNKWRVIEFSHVGNYNRQFWLCECECGTRKVVECYNLVSGRSRSCRKCSAKVYSQGYVTHGKTDSKAYRAWQSMKTRCYNEGQSNSFKYHGAVGVKVADEWLNDFQAFYDHIGDPPTKYHTVDRIDAFGDYAPGNVRWATQSEQMQNTRRVRDRARWNGIKECLGQEKKKA